LSTKKLVDLKRFWKIINIDYLIDEVFKKQDPLDQSEVHNSPINYIIPALQAKTAEVIYSSSKDLVDTFEAMRASMAMPIGFKMNPQIAVANELCCDSMLTTNPQTHISKAIALGATKILIIDVLNKNTRGPQHFLFNLWVKSRSKDFKDRYQFLDNQ
jgi:predicted patatin/cPLA2 family phospholipase